MKVRIKKNFRDTDTLQLMRIGLEANYDQARALKLARSGYVELLEPVEAANEQELETPDTSSEGSSQPQTAGSDCSSEPGENEKGEFDLEEEKNEFSPFPEKAEGPKKRGRKPKQ